MTPPRSKRKKIPRDRENDYTPEAAEARRAFLREQTGVGLEHVSHYSFDPSHSPRQHRALHRRRAGADRLRRPAARQRRARAGRVLRAPGHHRGHAGRQLQPRHEVAARGRRRDDHGPRRRDAARPRLRVRERPRGASVRRLARRALRRDQAGGGDHHAHRPAARHRAVLGQPDPVHALQLHDRRRRGPEPDRQGDRRRLRVDHLQLPGHHRLLPGVELRHRQEELADQRAAHARQARGRRGDDSRAP